MESDSPKESVAITAQRTAFEQLKGATDRARQAELDRSHGRAVGGVRLRVLPEAPYTLPPDNGGMSPGAPGKQP